MGNGVGFARITVVGIGLIGGSLAAAARELDPRPLVRGVDPDEGALGSAMEHGVIDEAATPDEAFSRGWFEGGSEDLVILAAPIPRILEWLERLGGTGFSGVVTDVASTKAAVVERAGEVLGGSMSFIGGHPMAGSERSGVEAASAGLFRGAYYVLTPSEGSDMDAFRRLHAFVTSLGARVISVDPESHDEAVALISHVPHMAAAALTNVAARAAETGPDVLRLAAGGFKDMTRIAAGSPELWSSISLDNRHAIVQGIDRLSDVLSEYRRLLEKEDADGIATWLEEAAGVRRRLPAQWVPATTALSELILPVRDKPGVISEVTTAVGRHRCNIEDIEIDHQTEDRAMLRLVLTDEGDLEGLVDDLVERGYEPETRPLEG
jgi:prephenate dehydrogenase